MQVWSLIQHRPDGLYQRPDILRRGHNLLGVAAMPVRTVPFAFWRAAPCAMHPTDGPAFDRRVAAQLSCPLGMRRTARALMHGKWALHRVARHFFFAPLPLAARLTFPVRHVEWLLLEDADAAAQR